MIIGKLWDSEYPWDVRVEKIGRAVASAGHTIHLVCRNRRREPTAERVGDFEVHRMPVWPEIAAGLDRLLSFPAFMNPRWFQLALAAFRRARVDAILCRDLPLAPLALGLGRSLRRPVALDIAEHYPGLLADLYNAHDFRTVNLLVRNPWLAAAVERQVLPRADAVFVVVEEMADRLVSLGVQRDRVTVVSNTPTRDRIAATGTAAPTPRRAGEPLRLVYLGNVERSRGLRVVLDALALLKPQDSPARMDVFGGGSSLETDRRHAVALGLDGRVKFHGHQPYEKVLAALPSFHAGVIPHHATDHWNYTIQNKMFDYMAAKLAVIVSSMPPASRIVHQTGAGLVFTDRDPVSLAQLLRDFPHGEAHAAMGEAGRRAVETRYNWDADGARLVDALERLLL